MIIHAPQEYCARKIIDRSISRKLRSHTLHYPTEQALIALARELETENARLRDALHNVARRTVYSSDGFCLGDLTESELIETLLGIHGLALQALEVLPQICH